MDAVFKEFMQYGALGVICVVLLYDVFFLQRKLLSVIEANTKALQAMATLLDRCQDKCFKTKGE